MHVAIKVPALALRAIDQVALHKLYTLQCILSQLAVVHMKLLLLNEIGMDARIVTSEGLNRCERSVCMKMITPQYIDTRGFHRLACLYDDMPQNIPGLLTLHICNG
jgi:hypothetical protein